MYRIRREGAGSGKRGFTFIELLVVIAIIAILAAILFPVFARARENARRASCQSNNKQVGLALMQYTQDYDERYIPGFYPYSVSGNTSTVWYNLLDPYLKSTQVLECPSRPANTGVALGWNYLEFGYEAQGSPPTGVNGRGTSLGWAVPLSLIECPAQTIPIGDGGMNGGAATALYQNDATKIADLHLGGSNYLFFDGHVKFFSKEKLVTASGQGLFTASCTDN